MRLVIIAVALAAVSLSACGRKEETATAVPTSESSYTVTTNEGGAVTTQTAASAGAGVSALAVNMPDYAPLYPGATVKASSTTSANDHQVGSVTYVTTAAPQAVIDFYKPKVAAAGFTTSADANIGVGLMYAATDQAKARSLQIIATAEKAGTAVVLSWTSPKS